MTLHQLRVFITVARLKSFTKAGEALKVRQPSVTLLVRSLQRELGAKLFERLGNKVHLTPAGEELLRRTEEIVTKVDILKDALDEIQGLKKGKLSVGGCAIAGDSFLPAAVQTFKKNNPGVNVTLRIERSHVLEKQLLDGVLDVTVMGLFPNSPLLVSEPYREEDIVAIASPKHPLAKRRFVPLKLLAKEPLITHERDGFLRDTVEQRFTEKGLPFSPALEINHNGGSKDAIKRAVASGYGIGFLPKCHVTWAADGGHLKMLKVPELQLTQTVRIVFHKERRKYPMVQSFVNFLRHYNN